MGRPRKPIPGWDDAEVENWLRTYRGTESQCIARLMPRLNGKRKQRAIARARTIKKRLLSEGLDFSEPRNLPPAPPRLTVHSRQEDPEPPAVHPHSPAAHTAPPPPEVQPPGPPPPKPLLTKHPSEMSTTEVLAWAVDTLALGAMTCDPSKSAFTANIKTAVDLHTSLLEARAAMPDGDMTEAELMDIISREARDMPPAILEVYVAEWKRRNPKATITTRSAS